MFDEYINEYIFSGSLPENASTYVKRSADDELYEALTAGKFCYVLNSRQSGKSSLRVRTMSRLTDASIECASIDLSSVSIQSATQENWYADLIVKLIDSFDLDIDFQSWWEKNHENSSLWRLGNFLEKILLAEIPENIVIFIDEIDSVLSLNFPTDDFFAFIRSCYNQRVDNPNYNRLTFCLLGVASPSNLIEDKKRTPFNIGQAISLKGFQLHEVEPLEKGLHGKYSNPHAMMKDILHWTGGQPFLTQKLCQFMVEESFQENPRTVEQVVRSRIIDNWESQDEPEHLRTIRDRILRNEQRAGYLLELYQRICQEEKSEVTADDTLEQSELQLSGLVVRQQNKLRVYNPIYREIFDQSWIETQLRNLRPYSESFRFWVASGGLDESRLLRGQALQDALKWADDKSLNYQDREFLAASQAKEKEEAIAVLDKEAQLERERKYNQVLTKANKKAQRRIRIGSAVLVVTLLGAVISVTMAAKEVKEAQKKLQETYTYVAYPKQLIELSEKLSSKGLEEQAREISDKANFEFKDSQLEQAYLHASKSLAYQYLSDWDSATESIKQSLNFLRGWEYNKKSRGKLEPNSEFLQTKIFALTVQGNLLKLRNNTQLARKAYQEAFDLFQTNSNKLKSSNQKYQIINIELVQSGLIELLGESSQGNDLSKVKEYVLDHYIAELDNFLKNKKWSAADRLTTEIMLYFGDIARGVQQQYLNSEDIKKLNCDDLRKIDNSWFNHSDGRFGFRVQKQIWLDTGNKEEYNYDTYYNFLKQVGWVEDIFVDYDRIIRRVEEQAPRAPLGTIPVPIPVTKIPRRLIPKWYGRNGTKWLFDGTTWAGMNSFLVHLSVNCNI
jgi:AAA-like domain/GUN4-like